MSFAQGLPVLCFGPSGIDRRATLAGPGLFTMVATMNRPFYDRAMFWATVAGAPLVVGAAVISTGNHILGWTIFAIGCVFVLLAIGFYFWRAKSHEGKPRFEIVSAERRCEPPLDRSPIYTNRDCTAHVVLVNRGTEGNCVVVVHFTGIGRAGNEFPKREHRTVVPRTPSNGYAEIDCHVGQMSPVYIEGRPEIEIVQG